MRSIHLPAASLLLFAVILLSVSQRGRFVSSIVSVSVLLRKAAADLPPPPLSELQPGRKVCHNHTVGSLVIYGAATFALVLTGKMLFVLCEREMRGTGKIRTSEKWCAKAKL